MSTTIIRLDLTSAISLPVQTDLAFSSSGLWMLFHVWQEDPLEPSRLPVNESAEDDMDGRGRPKRRTNNNAHKGKRRHCQDMIYVQAPVNNCVPTGLFCCSLDWTPSIGCCATTNHTFEYLHLLMPNTHLIPYHDLRHPCAHGHGMSSGFEWL